MGLLGDVFIAEGSLTLSCRASVHSRTRRNSKVVSSQPVACRSQRAPGLRRPHRGLPPTLSAALPAHRARLGHPPLPYAQPSAETAWPRLGSGGGGGTQLAGRSIRKTVGRVMALDPGVGAGLDIVVATASLEVGFNDPKVGAVIQHKAPRDVAQFLQREGPRRALASDAASGPSSCFPTTAGTVSPTRPMICSSIRKLPVPRLTDR